MRKGQGISINVIVIAAIALLVLVILSTLILRAGKTTSDGTGCEATQGTCVKDLDGTGTCPDGSSRDVTKACVGSTQNQPLICCRKI